MKSNVTAMSLCGGRTKPSLEGCPAVKKGRHRRFEEARKLKQSGPGAFDLGLGGNGGAPSTGATTADDEDYSALAEKYGVTFDEDEDDDEA